MITQAEQIKQIRQDVIDGKIIVKSKHEQEKEIEHQILMESFDDIVKKFDKQLEMAARNKNLDMGHGIDEGIGWDLCKYLHHGYMPLIDKLIAHYKAQGFRTVYYKQQYEMIIVRA